MSLDAQRWQRLSPLLDEALELSPEARAIWLDALQAREPDLVDELRSLLAGQAVADRARFLTGQAAPALAAQQAGRRVGAYTLLEPLGEGGMGEVWLAERHDGRYEGRAAVKLLHAGLLQRALAERFRREGAILAKLSHPHIARLLDAGLTDDGHPYLVLEHVGGQRIDLACDARKLGVRERIELFAQVLQAVQHAHNRLVVHRDLKPGNVMVDAAGTVKLLDFGIAKLLDTEDAAGEATALTQEAGRVLTPQYAAPEQRAGEAVTTATDVYALGLLLYELLTGQHPRVDAQGRHDPAPAVALPLASRVVTDPQRRGAAELERHARARSTTPARLAAALAGDIDNILVKCLRPDPVDRYGTVEALSDDLRRHLLGMTVKARPDTLGYRVSRFLRRYRLAVAATVVALVALSITAGVALWQWREARLALKEADFNSRRGIAAHAFANEWMRAVSADTADPKARRAILEKARHILNTQRFEDSATIHAYLLQHLAARFGQAGYSQGMYELALQAVQELPPDELPHDHSYSASILAIALHETGRVREGLAQAEKALAYLKGVDDEEALGQAHQAESLAASSMGLHDRAVAAAVNAHKALSDAGRSVLPMYSNLRGREADALWRAGRVDEAAARARAVLAMLAERNESNTLPAHRMKALLARVAAGAGDESAVRATLAEPWAAAPKGLELLLWPRAWLLAREGRVPEARELHREAAAAAAAGGGKLRQFESAASAFEYSLRIDRAAALRDEWPALQALGDECAALGADVQPTLQRLLSQLNG